MAEQTPPVPSGSTMVNLIDIAANHPPIVRALEARDGALAERLIAEHTNALASFDPASVVEHLP